MAANPPPNGPQPTGNVRRSYAPPRSAQPPPTFPPNPPPGYVPPPGYLPPRAVMPGYLPVYVYVAPQYQPAMAPPQPKPPPQPVAPASGTLFQAWVSLTVRPTLRNFAAWSQRADGRWIALSYLTAILFSTMMRLFMLSYDNGSKHIIGYLFGTNFSVWVAISLLIGLDLVLYLANLSILTSFAPRKLGTFGQRFNRLLRPTVLILPGKSLLSLLTVPVFIINSALAGENTIYLAILLKLTILLLLLFLLLAYFFYTIFLSVQAYAAGSSIHRGVIVAYLLAKLFFEVIFILVLLIMSHYPPS